MITYFHSTPYFLNTEYIPTCIDRIRQELENPKWYISPYDVERSDLSTELRSHIQDLLPFKISDAGFLKRRPTAFYHPHMDPKRTFALNMLLTDEEPDKEGTYVVHTGIYNNAPFAGSKRVSYTKNCFTVLNTKKIHYAINNSTADRIILSIGCNEIPYETVIQSIAKDLLKL
jgi:hypothetical protein